MVLRRLGFVLGRCVARRIRMLAFLLVFFTISLMYISIKTTNSGLKREVTSRHGVIQSTIHVKTPRRSRLDFLAVMGTDSSSDKLKFLSSKFTYLFILPHGTQGIMAASEAGFISNVDKLMVDEVIEFLDSTEDKYDGGACQMNPKSSASVQRQACRFEKRNWTLLVHKDGRNGSETLAKGQVNFMECNIFEGAFVIRRKIFEKFYLVPQYGDTVLLDFFLRTKGKLNLALLSACSWSEELHRPDRGILTTNPFYTDYIKLGSAHDVVRIIKENQITWTKCSYNIRLCPDKPLQPRVSLSRQLKPVCCNRVLDKMLVDVVQGMNAIRLDYRIEYGTLLGAVRSGTIIPWTRDVDIGLREEDYFKERIFEKLKSVIQPKGYSVPLVKGQRRVVPLFPPRQSVSTSLFDNVLKRKLFSQKILRTIKKMAQTKTRWQDLGYLDFYIAKKERFDSLARVTINGREYASFANAKEVLKDWYGPNYMKAVKKRSAPVEIDINKRKERRQNERNKRKKMRQRRNRIDAP